MTGVLWASQIQEILKSQRDIFTPPHKHLNPVQAPIEHLAENLRAVEDHFERHSIPTQTRGDNTTITSLATVTSITSHCHTITLSSALQTQFS